MKKTFLIFVGLVLALCMTTIGCGRSSGTEESNPGETNAAVSESFAAPSSKAVSEDGNSGTDTRHLIVRFGNGGEPFVMHLEDNSTAAAIARYVGTTSWNLPIYSYDESDVMEYYDIPSRYDIPDNSVTVTQAHAGDVFYSDPNRIVLYYADAEINEAYTRIGTFDATEEFIHAVVNNPVLEGRGNQIAVISAGE